MESLVEEKYGSHYLKKKWITKELAQVNKELNKLKTKVISLEQRKAELRAILNDPPDC